MLMLALDYSIIEVKLLALLSNLARYDSSLSIFDRLRRDGWVEWKMTHVSLYYFISEFWQCGRYWRYSFISFDNCDPAVRGFVIVVILRRWPMRRKTRREWGSIRETSRCTGLTTLTTTSQVRGWAGTAGSWLPATSPTTSPGEFWSRQRQLLTRPPASVCCAQWRNS